MFDFIKSILPIRRKLTTDYELIAHVMTSHVQDLTEKGIISADIESLGQRTVQYYGFNAADVDTFYQAKGDYPACFVLNNGEHRNMDGKRVAVTDICTARARQ